MNKILFNFCIAIVTTTMIYSCSGNQNVQASKGNNYVSLDSLEYKWDKAWNEKDSNAIYEMLDKDAAKISENSTIGRDACIKDFVRTHIGLFGSMKTTKLSAEASEDIAFMAGSFTANTLSQDSVTGSEHGVFTIIWKKQEDKSWKMRLIQLQVEPD